MSDAQSAICIEDLNIRYRGQKAPALDGLSLDIAAGSYFGLLGPNGAGKTTLISFLCGQVEGRYKSARILGAGREQIHLYKRRLGYAPQEIALYPTLSARANLEFFARLLDLPRAEVDRTLEWIGLEERAGDAVETFSGGMKRRLNLGVALLNKPELLILDEPTVGVDPQSRNFIFEKILELKKHGMTLIYSTHYLEEVKRLCDSAGILVAGKVIAKGSIQDVLGTENLEQRYLEWAGRELG